jgi:NAD(P)-dependent dehydrogenase (short-subunit alcohol dehydrogenase family)
MVEMIEGKVVVVTGSGGGIGKAICSLFHRSGARVVPLYRDRKEYNSLKKDGVVGKESYGFQIDLTRESVIMDVVGQICRDFGKIDVLINNAGVGYFGPIDSIKTSEWKEMLEVNLSGTFLLTREAVKGMKDRGGGAIINITSLAGVTGYPKCSAYGATKAGVIGLTRSLSRELIPHGIRVVAICPGSVDTSFQDNIPKIIPREKMLSPEDVARTALFVASLPKRAMIEEIIIRPRVIT